MVIFEIEWNKDGIRMKFDVSVPNSHKLSLILPELVHELGTRTHWGTLHQESTADKPTDIVNTSFWQNVNRDFRK